MKYTLKESERAWVHKALDQKLDEVLAPITQVGPTDTIGITLNIEILPIALVEKTDEVLVTEDLLQTHS